MLTTLLYNGEIIIKHNTFFTVYIYYFLPTRPTTFNPTTQTYTASTSHIQCTYIYKYFY